MATVQANREFLHSPGSPRAARRFAVCTLSAAGVPAATLDSAALVVSELATNAVLHTNGPFSLGLIATDETVTICVEDASRAFEPRSQPATRDDIGGRGLAIVAALGRAWGCNQRPRGKTIWCDLALDDRSGSVAAD